MAALRLCVGAEGIVGRTLHEFATDQPVDRVSFMRDQREPARTLLIAERIDDLCLNWEWRDKPRPFARMHEQPDNNAHYEDPFRHHRPGLWLGNGY